MKEEKMNSKKSWTLLIPSLILILIFNANCRTVNDSLSREQLIMQILYKQSQQFHYSPVKIDDDYSKKVFNNFLEDMDSGKRFLTKKDVQPFEKYKNLQDEAFKDGNLDFFYKFSEVYVKAVEKTKNYYSELINNNLLQAKDESFIIDAEKRDWVNDDKELKDLWRKSIQYDFNSRYYDALEELEKEKKTRPIDSIVMEIKKDMKESYDTYFERIGKLKDADRFEVYVNSFLHIYDPHTEYFSPKEKENFNINMSGKLEGIGARLQTEKEFTKVSSIVPGGPAWKQKELEANDIIIAVKQEKADFVDIKGMNIDDVVKQVRGKKGTIVTLKVKKPNNEVKEITITRDEVILDEGVARSAIIQSDSTGEKIGYLRLPKFYAELESPNGISCAKDVAKELRKLKDEGVTSLVFDIRNNGGGSLQEVVEMAGLFFKNGAVVQVKDRDRVNSYNDTDQGVEFDGPVVLMVNNMSASASEILAACLQDYKRAVVIGSNRSFGKGTVQRFVNLDRINGFDQYKPLGEMKITIQKYYRVNGGSVQLKGVEPDIQIPDIYQYLDNGEKEYDFAMKYDVISPNATAQIDKPIVNYDEIISKSKERVLANAEFNLINQQARSIKTLRDDVEFPLQFDKFKKKLDQRKEETKKYEESNKKEIPNLLAYNLKSDMNYINMDSSRIGRNEDFIKNIKKDQLILESMNVLKDIKK